MKKSTLRLLSFLSLPSLLLLLILAGGCVKHKTNSGEAMEAWTKSLDDSIRNVQLEIDSAQNNLDILHHQVGEWLRDFTYVNHQREVEGYTIFNGWQNRYPLTSTGLVARITESEGLELIAALKGGEFDRISVTAGTETLQSDAVPHDQALNYRANGLNTVLFTGGKADSIAQLIADNELNNINVTFIGRGKAGSWSVPAANKKMIAATWMLYSSQREAERLERRIPVLNEKIKILRQTIDRHSPHEDDQQTEK